MEEKPKHVPNNFSSTARGIVGITTEYQEVKAIPNNIKGI